MTEEYRLNVYIHFDKKSNLKIIYASEDNTEENLDDMVNSASNLLNDLEKYLVTESIILSEKQMFERFSKYYEKS